MRICGLPVGTLELHFDTLLSEQRPGDLGVSVSLLEGVPTEDTDTGGRLEGFENTPISALTLLVCLGEPDSGGSTGLGLPFDLRSGGKGSALLESGVESSGGGGGVCTSERCGLLAGSLMGGGGATL